MLGASPEAEERPFYSNDLKLTAADISLASPENFNVEADNAISYRAVVRRVLPNGQTLESAPSSPVFAFNNLIRSGTWTNSATGSSTDNRVVIFVVYDVSNTAQFTVGQKFSGVIKNAVSIGVTSGVIDQAIDEPNLNGRHIFEVSNTSVSLFKETVEFFVDLPLLLTSDTGSTDRLGYLDFAFDRYSDLEVHFPEQVVAGDFIDLYYSRTEVDISDNPLAIPDGDYYLAREIEVQSADLTLNSISVDFSDGIFQKGLPLYTNPSDGDLSRQPNTPPPGASCIESWQGHMFYGNTYQPHRLELTHIGGNMTANRNFSIQFTDAG